MEIFKLEELTKEIVNKHFENSVHMEIKTKSGTHYHIIKQKNGYCCYSHFCWNQRPLTKAMKAVFA